jgi:head-tail adaptor
MATKPTSIGAMRYRIQIQSPSAAKDDEGYGQLVDTYTTIATVWAAKENPLAGNTEKVFGDMETSVTRAHWIIHFRDGLSTRHRIQEGPDAAPTYYDIMNIREIGYREKLLLITEKRTV